MANQILNAETARVHLLESKLLKNSRLKTLLWDGWEDKSRRSLYGGVAAETNMPPIVLGLRDMTGKRGTASGYLESITDCLKSMDIEDRKCFIALTTDNPSVMKLFRSMFQGKYPWVLVRDEMH